MLESQKDEELSPTRLNLCEGAFIWELASQDRAKTPSDIPRDSDWQRVARATTVAHALQMADQWSLDSPPVHFDAGIWWFRLRFDHDTVEHSNASETWLVFDGLATHCQVWLNGGCILSSANMFRQYRSRVDCLLQPEGNVLLLRFDALDNTLQAKRPRPRWRTPMVSHQQLRWIRTTLLGRTPGWSPPAAAVGPWRPIWLEQRQPAQLIRSALCAAVSGGTGQLRVDCWFQERSAPHTRAVLIVEGPDTRIEEPLQTDSNDHGVAQLTLPDVHLWWPHTHGDPVLYQVTLQLREADGNSISQRLGQVGFRTMGLMQDTARFQILVNDEAVFCRGACWMPLDVVSLQASEDDYLRAVLQIKAAGINMLRLAGSTVYETSVFFDVCDAHGIMVWQDLMFANMDYPSTDADFLQDVQDEVAQQLMLWQSHPSLAVVCGNSEVSQQAAMWGAPRDTWAPDLFHQILPDLVKAQLPDVIYWPSSAHGGAFPHQPESGTCSYYGVGAYKRGLDDALGSKLSFATECLAFANIPTVSTLQRSPAGEAPQVHSPEWKARVYRDRTVGWDFDDVREHYVERLLGVRSDELRAFDPARHLVLGRAVAAEVMARTMAAWRTQSPRCGGALVWFLRDLWAGAGCGLLDDQGGAKSVFHALARVQQPLLAFISDQGLNGLYLHLVNETANPMVTSVELRLYRHGETLVARGARELLIAPRSTGQWAATDWLEGFMDLSWAYRFGPAATDLAVLTWRDHQNMLLGQALYFEPRQMILFNGPTGLQARAGHLPDGNILVELSTRAVSYAVHFESRGWQPSDDYFHMPPDSQKSVRFTPTTVAPGHWHAHAMALNVRQPVPILLQPTPQ